MSRKLCFVIAFFMLASCSIERPYGGSYKKAYSDRQCNHSHICCQVDCPCCSKIPKKNQKKKLLGNDKNHIDLKNRKIN